MSVENFRLTRCESYSVDERQFERALAQKGAHVRPTMETSTLVPLLVNFIGNDWLKHRGLYSILDRAESSFVRRLVQTTTQASPEAVIGGWSRTDAK